MDLSTLSKSGAKDAVDTRHRYDDLYMAKVIHVEGVVVVMVVQYGVGVMQLLFALSYY